jgi:superfamily II DNA helicase RecQ
MHCLFPCRKLAILKDCFGNLRWKGKKIRIPVMALTATATHRVRDDIMDSLKINGGNTKIVLTTFYRPNLIFSVSPVVHCQTKYLSHQGLLIVKSESNPVLILLVWHILGISFWSKFENSKSITFLSSVSNLPAVRNWNISLVTRIT